MTIETNRGAQTGQASNALITHPATDLCVLALLAESGELIAQNHEGNPSLLTQQTLERLTHLSGPRPPGYWSDLLRCSKGLDLLDCTNNRWFVINANAEMLGATQSECFPALMAVWLSQPTWLGELLELAWDNNETRPEEFPTNPMLQMALLQFLEVFETDVWYPLTSLYVMVNAVTKRHGIDAVPERLTRLLLERVYLVLGVCETGLDGHGFRVRPGIALPQVSFLDRELCDEVRKRIKPQCRADVYRSLIARKLSENTSWTQVNQQLARFREARRDREASDSCLRLLDDRLRIATSPEIPFRDCLYLARFARLHKTHTPGEEPGCYVFEIDRAALKQAAARGESSFVEFSGFLTRRCCRTSASQVRDLLQAL